MQKSADTELAVAYGTTTVALGTRHTDLLADTQEQILVQALTFWL